MSDAPPTRPLAAALFGWTFGGRGGMLFAALSAGLGAVSVVLDYIRPREGLDLPFEAQPGFYAAVGAGAVAAALLAASVLRFLVLRDTPYTDEIEPEASTGEARDVDHA